MNREKKRGAPAALDELQAAELNQDQYHWFIGQLSWALDNGGAITPADWTKAIETVKGWKL